MKKWGFHANLGKARPNAGRRVRTTPTREGRGASEVAVFGMGSQMTSAVCDLGDAVQGDRPTRSVQGVEE